MRTQPHDTRGGAAGTQLSTLKPQLYFHAIISTTLCREMNLSLEWDASVNPVESEGENYEKNRGYRYRR
jgi:hypothetical protein